MARGDLQSCIEAPALGKLLPVMVVEERHEEEDTVVAEAVVAVMVMVDLTLIHNKLLHNNNSSNSNNSSGLVRCQDKCMAITGNTTKSTAAKQRLIVQRVLILSLNKHLGLITQILL